MLNTGIKMIFNSLWKCIEMESKTSCFKLNINLNCYCITPNHFNSVMRQWGAFKSHEIVFFYSIEDVQRR